MSLLSLFNIVDTIAILPITWTSNTVFHVWFLKSRLCLIFHISSACNINVYLSTHTAKALALLVEHPAYWVHNKSRLVLLWNAAVYSISLPFDHALLCLQFACDFSSLSNLCYLFCVYNLIPLHLSFRNKRLSPASNQLLIIPSIIHLIHSQVVTFMLFTLGRNTPK